MFVQVTLNKLFCCSAACCKRSQFVTDTAIFGECGLLDRIPDMLGRREEEARSHVAEGLKIDPDWSLEAEQEIYSYKNPAELERQLDALRKVGLPEHRPKKASD